MLQKAEVRHIRVHDARHAYASLMSFRRGRNSSIHSRGIGTQAHGATPITQGDEIVVCKMPYVFPTVY